MAIPVYPPELADKECAKIRGRRSQAVPHATSPEVIPEYGDNGLPVDTVGVALSGGGIRSATFCLGVFRALARIGKIRSIDFLSTVSGGGYAGSFLGGLYVPRPDGPKPTTERVEDDLLGLSSKPVDWLRENGRYMSPNGAGDTLLAGAVALRNWIAVMFVVSSFLFTLFAAATGIAWLVQAAWLWARRYQAFAAVTDDFPWSSVDPDRFHLAGSPYLGLALVLVLVTALPLGWAYWFTQRHRSGPWKAKVPPYVFPVILLVGGLVLALTRGTSGAALIAFESAAALAWWGVAMVAGERGERFERNRLSRWLSSTLWFSAALFVFGLVDSLGRTLASPGQRVLLWKACIAAGATLFAGFTAAQKLFPLLGSRAGKRLSPTPGLVAALAAGLVTTILLVGVSALTQWVIASAPLWLALACGITVTALTAWTMPFLNLSSHSSLYGSRLTRAYLGASNPKRQDRRSPITELLSGDQIRLSEYDPPAAGGPLHLVNVTLNETMSAKSQLEQRDRKGLAMAVGPCGISVGRTCHALWKDRGSRLTGIPSERSEGDRVIFPPEDARDTRCEELDLGAWAGISGAAFTTGLGSRTSLSLSLLLGLSNVRLGYWWDSGTEPEREGRANAVKEAMSSRVDRWVTRLVPVHAYLLQELLARFHGPARRYWYLSDGGHFENTGAYELIRRRLPFVVLCDAGCDPGYRFDDLANLARRVRTDFHAELAIFTGEQLDDVLPADLRGYFGTVEDFRKEAPAARPHALLAGIFYDDSRREHPPATVMVVLKPGLSNDEPVDVVQYQREHAAFPHESTLDQFFDEAQWESYRRLGEHIASRIFEDVREPGVCEPGVWQPLDFCRPPLEKIRWRGATRSLGLGRTPARTY